MFDLILGAGLAVQAVLLLLLVLSVASWAIIIFKARELGAVDAATARFLDVYTGAGIASAHEAARESPQNPVCAVFSSGYEDLGRLRERKGDAGAMGPELAESVVQRLWIVAERLRRLVAQVKQCSALLKILYF